MQKHQFQVKEDHLIKLYCQDKEKYIFFSATVPQYILPILQKAQDNDEEKTRFQMLYQQIAGQYVEYNQPSLYLKEEQLIWTLKSVNIFGGTTFLGCREYVQNAYVNLQLNHISNIKFSNLTMLRFYDCSINNIQALYWVDMKHIKAIYLNNNAIVSLQPLAKTSFRQLLQLILSRNNFPYHTFTFLQRSSSPQLIQITSYDFVYNQIPKLKHELKDVRLFMKMQIDSNRWNEKSKKYQSLRSKLGIGYYTSEKNMQEIKWKTKINQHSPIQLLQYR